jgi:hypothetical protein
MSQRKTLSDISSFVQIENRSVSPPLYPVSRNKASTFVNTVDEGQALTVKAIKPFSSFINWKKAQPKVVAPKPKHQVTLKSLLGRSKSMPKIEPSLVKKNVSTKSKLKKSKSPNRDENVTASTIPSKQIVGLTALSAKYRNKI